MNWYSTAQETEKPVWQQTRDEYAGAFPYWYAPERTDEEMKQYYAKRRKWDNGVWAAVAEGIISPEQAKGLGLNMLSNEQPKPLPEIIYHVTTAKDRVMQEGLKTRDDLKMDFGTGLGGGTSNTISFTTDLQTARDIKRSILEARKVAIGEITTDQMIDQATKGTGTERPWINEIIKQYHHNWKPGDPIPRELAELLKGRDFSFSVFPETYEQFKRDHKEEGWEMQPDPDFSHVPDRTRFWTRILTPNEKTEKIFWFYKVFSTFRESVGGPMNPLFFSSDPVQLAKIPEDQVAILEFRPKQGGVGKIESALGEWRTWSGNAVEFVREVI